VSEVELQSLRERIEHYQKEVASFKEKACADGRRIREQDKKMEDMKRRFKNMERWFEVDKTLLESQFHSTLLETTDTSFQMGRQSMASLYSKAAQEFDGGKGIFLLDWECYCGGSMSWNSEKPTSTPGRRKSFAKKFFGLKLV